MSVQLTEDAEDRLAELALELIGRVRDDAPDDNARWLLNATTEEERWGLLFALAAAVPQDRTWRQLTAWLRLAPCGTPAAAKRHRYRGEPLDPACVAAERTRNLARYHGRRAA
jgi:hypothetical protein